MFWCWYFIVVLTAVCPMTFITANRFLVATVHLRSEAMARAVKNQILWQSCVLPGFFELFGDRCQMPAPGAFRGKHPSLFLLRVSCQERQTHPRTDRHKSSPFWRLAVITKYRLVAQSTCSQRMVNTSFWLCTPESRMIINTSRSGCF